MEYEKANKAAVVAINNAGGKGKHLPIKATELIAAPKKIAVTAPMLCAR